MHIRPECSTFAENFDMAKLIEYMAPVDWLVGNLSGNQSKSYGEGNTAGYDVPDGEKESAVGYMPRLVAKRIWRTKRKYFQIRTKTSVNMTSGTRTTMAVMGGAGAMFASLIRNKSAQIYIDCKNACPYGETLRSFVFPKLRAGLTAKESSITITDGINIVNPWTSSETPNVQVSQAVLDKFSSVLSNS